MDSTSVHTIKCSEVWGGIWGDELDVQSGGIRASMFSIEGEHRSDVYFFSQCSSGFLTRIAVGQVHDADAEQVEETAQWVYNQLVDKMNSADGAEIVQELNALTVERRIESSAIVAAFYTQNNHLYSCYAGHLPILIARQRSGAWSITEDATPADSGVIGTRLGTAADGQYTQRSQELSHGDRVFLFTDGLIRTPNASGLPFGRDRLTALLNELADEKTGAIREGVKRAWQQFTQSKITDNDATFIAIEIL